MRFFKTHIVATAQACVLALGPAAAQDAQGANVSIELNALDAVDNGCRMSFLV